MPAEKSHLKANEKPSKSSENVLQNVTAKKGYYKNRFLTMIL